ncbi:penicillin-binding protein activator [Zymobacter sp. IVIA_12111.31 C1]|uniref:penicillin-binding protein activator n=1 Tax=Zymobacter sp. IVIA_12111.31 C1 TaxID=3394854 RepID=UPI0039C040BA
MRDAFQRLAGLALTATLLGGCASAPSFFGGFGSNSPERLLTDAQSQPLPQATATRLKAATLLSQQGEQGLALSILSSLDDRLLSPQDRIQWALLTARLGLEQHNSGATFKAVALLENSNLSLATEDRRQLTIYRAQAFGEQGDHLKAASMLLDAQRRANSDAGYNDAIWLQLQLLSNPQLSLLPGKDDLSIGWQELSALARSTSQQDALQAAVRDWQQRHAQHPAAIQLPAALAQLAGLAAVVTPSTSTDTPSSNAQAPTGTPTRIAVFLPQSGSLAPLAKAIKAGIDTQRSALLSAGQPAPDVDYYDTTTATIDDLYAQAKAKGAQVVIGPLDKDAVTALESRSDVTLPTLALNYGSSAQNATQSLYEYGLSAEDEARQAAQYAGDAGLTQASLLTPDNDWGHRVEDAFRQQWQYQNHQIMTAVRYAPTAPVSGSVKTLAAVGRPQMVFMFAMPEYARQVPPFLKYLHMDNLPIYATSHVYTGRANASQDSDLNGVLFPNIPWYLPELYSDSNPMPYKDSYQRLNADGKASITLLKLNAMGVDAYELAQRLARFNDSPDTKLEGATGTLQLDANHRFQRQLPWARFQQGRPTPAQPTSQS